MPGPSTARQKPSKTPTEIRNGAIDFTGKLDDGEALTGVPVITIHSKVPAASADPTFSSVAVSTAAKIINKVEVAAGKAVLYSATGGTEGTNYVGKAACGTTAVPPQTLEMYFAFRVETR